MRIATLQLSPSMRDVAGNIRRADRLVDDLEQILTSRRAQDKAKARASKPLDLLVLPEMVFTGNHSVISPAVRVLYLLIFDFSHTGYNFPSLEAIRPYLERFEHGVTAQWAQKTARRLECVVCAGYPEIADVDRPSMGNHASLMASQLRTPSQTELANRPNEGRYNSLYICAANGSTLLNYQKRFLYYTDERWAHEGSNGEGFFNMPLTSSHNTPSDPQASPPLSIPTSVGICMDINPYKFEAPWTAFEFAHQVQRAGSRLVILSMAWSTSLPTEVTDDPVAKRDPEMATFKYWVERFYPLLDDGNNSVGEGTTYVVFANRAGAEPGTDEIDPAVYAGTSCVMGIRRRQPSHDPEITGEGGVKAATCEVLVWKVMGKAVEGVCYVDTDDEPVAVFHLRKPEDSD